MPKELLSNFSTYVGQFQTAGPIVIFLILVCVSVGLVRSKSAVAKAVCLTSLVAALVAATYASYLWGAMNPRQKFVSTWAVADPCRLATQIRSLSLPQSLDLDEDIKPYLITDTDRSQMVILITSLKSLDLNKIGTIYADIRNKASPLKFCVHNLTQVDVIELLPKSASAKPEDLTCDTALSTDFDFRIVDHNGNKGALCS